MFIIQSVKPFINFKTGKPSTETKYFLSIGKVYAVRQLTPDRNRARKYPTREEAEEVKDRVFSGLNYVSVIPAP